MSLCSIEITSRQNLIYINLKYFYTLLLIFVSSLLTYAQVGIGTTYPDPSSVLDIKSTNTGLLIPRVRLSNTTLKDPVSNPVESLLVYNTQTTGDLTPGFYYWTGNVWKALVTSGDGGNTGGWNLNGNSVSISSFLGTTNYSSLKFKVNSANFGQLHPLGGLALGKDALANSSHSIAIGTSANASTSNQSVAIGAESTASGFQSAAMGYKSFASNNSALALGNFTFASGQNSTAIGNGAVTTQRNAVVIGNVADANVGIGTSTPDSNARLDVNGQFKLGEKGTIQKGISSFKKNGQYIGAISPNSALTIVLEIPAAARPSSTDATVLITPAYEFNNDIIYFAKLKSISELSIRFFNMGSNFRGQSSDFFITIMEFIPYP